MVLKRLRSLVAGAKKAEAPQLDLSKLQLGTKPITTLDLLYEDSIRDSFEAFREEMIGSMIFPQKGRLRAYCIDQALSKVGKDGMYLEFGVFRGDGLNHFARKIAKHGLKAWGFDSLVGLSENWTGNHLGREAGSYTVRGKIPKLEPNAEVVPGWIQDTLPGFLEERPDEKIAFAHLDFDTYTPTAFALERIRSRLVPGSIVLFDELYGYPGWRLHEYKALKETLPDDCYEFVGFSRQSVGIEITSAPAA